MNEKKQPSKLNMDLANQVERVIRKVLIAEHQKRHMRNPHGIYDDIKKIIEKEIDAS